jgi:hypothetical protein
MMAAPPGMAAEPKPPEAPPLGRSQEALRLQVELERQEALKRQQTEQQRQLVLRQREAAAMEEARKSAEQADGRVRAEEQRRLAEADAKRRATEDAGQQRLATIEPQQQAAPVARRAERPAAASPPVPQAARPAPPGQLVPPARPAPAVRAPSAMAVPPAPAPSAVPVPQRVAANLPEQIRQAQAELNRLGCLKEQSDGQLNDETRKAVKAFLTVAAGSAVEAAITDELIAGMRLQPDGVCNGNARAVAIRVPPPPNAQPTTAAQPAGKAVGTGF